MDGFIHEINMPINADIYVYSHSKSIFRGIIYLHIELWIHMKIIIVTHTCMLS